MAGQVGEGGGEGLTFSLATLLGGPRGTLFEDAVEILSLSV